MIGNYERIKFDLEFQIINNNKAYPSYIDIYIDELNTVRRSTRRRWREVLHRHHKYSDFLVHDTQNISFFHDCSFKNENRLGCRFKIVDTLNILDNIVCTNIQIHLAQVKIDEINVTQIISPKCYNILELSDNSLSLQEKIYETTHFSRSTTWYLDFTSPFYLYVMNLVGGNKQ